MKKHMLLALAIGLLALVGCNAPSGESSNTHVFAGFGYSIDYPDGWLADTRGAVTTISELRKDHRRAFRGGGFDLAGISISLEHRDINFMEGIGLPENATIDDLLELNTNEFDWQVSDVSETEIFGVPALRVELGDDSTDVRIMYMGFIEDEAFLFGVGAPSQDALDDFRPAWEAMLDTIQQVDE